MPDAEQLQRLWDISDNVLYPEAVAFIHDLVEVKGCSPLPASQVAGLMNVARSTSYGELERYIRHQRERDWQPSKRDIKTLYTELEKWLIVVRTRRIRTEFHLLSDKFTSSELNEIMAKLAYDFLRHLVAENMLIATQKESERRGRENKRR